MKLLRRFIPYIFFVLATLVAFRGVISDLNNTYFSQGGDGLKAYYCALYHAKFDTDANRTNGMNYPWGESIYFADAQPLVANAIRFVDHHLFPCADKMVGIFNFLMIFSVLLGSVFLFLIFKRLKMPEWYSALLAIGISFLSPQIGRLPGHFSLGWVFWIPLLLYLMLLIIEKPSWGRCTLFGGVTLMASLMHMYFFIFSAALAGIWVFEWLFFRFDKKQVWRIVACFFIQLVLPFVVLQWLMVDHQADRAMHPYGFFAYRAYPGSIFLPINKWYAPFISKLSFTHKYDWEALAYIGVVASVGFCVLFGKWIAGLFKRNLAKSSFTGSRSMDILFWASLFTLLFSFGIPFIFGFEKLQNSIGFLSQLRAVGRFSWLFYYVVNIVVWVKIYQYFTFHKIERKLALALMFFLILILGFEAYDYSKSNIACLNNKIPQLNDRENNTSDNYWVNQIDVDKYQAIMPIPYFHVGSESSWIESRCDIARQMYIASLKTGLPCNGVMLGRTSLSQTYKNIELSKTPWKKFRVLDEYPNNKPLLLTVAKCDELNTDEKRLVENASFITTTPNFDLYEMPLDSLRAIPAKYNFPQRYSNMVDSIKRSIAEGKIDCFFEFNGNLICGTEKLKGIKVSNDFQRILETSMTFDLSKKVYIRFWVKDYVKDMVARTPLLIIQDKTNHEFLEEKYTDIWRHIRSFNDDWALVEIVLEPKQEDEIIKLLFKNSILGGQNFYFDEVSVSQMEF